MNCSLADDFAEALIGLDMLRPDGEATNLFFVADKSKVDNPHIRIALEQAERYKADAVFFRGFPDDDKRSPISQVYIYHDTTFSSAEAKYAEIHRRLWNAGIVPLMFILGAGEVKILNCRQEPEIDEATNRPIYKPFRKLEQLVVAEQAFVTRAISAGTLWEDPVYENDFVLEKTAYYKLLSHLKAFRGKLVKEKILTESVANRVLVIAILVKYLNDRKDLGGNGVFPIGFFSQFTKSKRDDLVSLFHEQGSCVKLFDHLSQHFNGGIFELAENEREELAKANLSAVADFLKGDRAPTGQGLFWPLYSFEDLPVELISNIYEEFLAKSDGEGGSGVVYTPPMLVWFLLDQCLPISPKTLEWKILDPACGSGIFLVSTFKRLIHCWRMVNNWILPKHHDLQEILKKSIFGFDVNSEAVLVTAFSLCVALCDQLDPLVIWNELKFDDLRHRNLQTRDFFEIVKSGEFEGFFDLIIGNPPFKSELSTDAAKEIEGLNAKRRPRLPDKQVALLFLEQSLRLVRGESKVCLIQPASPLLYNRNAQLFRAYLFGRFDINYVFDFTPLEGVLFKAQVAAAAVIGSGSAVSTGKVLHVTFHRTRAIKEKLFFELDPYDFHWISRKAVLESNFVWKANLLGGGRLHRILEQIFANGSTLGKYLEEKRENEGWVFGEGYSVGCGSHLNSLPNAKELTQSSPGELKRQFGLKRTPKTASWITGKADVVPDALTREGVNWELVKPCEKIFFQENSSSIRAIFSEPHILIREVVEDSSIPTVFLDKNLVFSKQIIGVHAPHKDRDKLLALAMRLNGSKLYGVLAAVVSGRMLVSRNTSLLESDILALPYSEDASRMDLNDWQKIVVDDIANYLIDFRWKGEKAIVMSKANESDLIEFGHVYCSILNPVYKHFHSLRPLSCGSFICYPFCYGEAPLIDLPSEDEVTPYLQQLVSRQFGCRLYLNRIIRLYEQNVVFMVKPDQKRYWLRSIALRDADETLIDLLEQGY